MRLLQVSIAIAAISAAVAQLSPPSLEVAAHQLTRNGKRDISKNELWKRKGGGGGGGRGGGGGGGGRGSSSSSSSSSGGRTSSSSNVGGQTKSGSGPRPVYGSAPYGGGAYYGGGGAIPYKSGEKSKYAGLVPIFLGASVLAFWPGVWLYGAYLYPHPEPWVFFNETSNQEESRPVICACEPYLVCGCDWDDSDQFKQYMTLLIGNGDYDSLNHTLVTIAEVNGTVTILINGTLPNGTTASGGEEDAGVGTQTLLIHAGWWPVLAAVCAMVFSV